MPMTLTIEEWANGIEGNTLANPTIITLRKLLAQLNSNISMYNILDIGYEIIKVCDEVLSVKSTFLVEGMLTSLRSNTMNFIKSALNLNTAQQTIDALNERRKYKEIDPEYIPGQIVDNAPLPRDKESKTHFIRCRLRVRFHQITAGQVRFFNFGREQYHREYHDREKSSTKYLDISEREKYRIVISQGKFMKLSSITNGESSKLSLTPYDTASEVAHEGDIGKGFAIFVVNTRGEFFSGSKIKNVIQHSSFLSGKAVLFAGFLKIENGTLREIINYSGHYLTTVTQIIHLLNQIEGNGIDLSSVLIKRVNEVYDPNVPPTFTATDVTEFRRIMKVHKDKIVTYGQVLPPLNNQKETVVTLDNKLVVR